MHASKITPSVQGVILDEMRTFVAERYGYRTWLETLRKAGKPSDQRYALDKVYPDDELGLLAMSAAAVTGTPLPQLMERFGEALLPEMMRVYSYLIEPDWTYTDFLLQMEPLLHKALQLHTPGPAPARVTAVREGKDAVRITYTSPLRACAAVHGIIVGAAKEYGVKANVAQTACVLRGDPECVFEVTIQPRA